MHYLHYNNQLSKGKVSRAFTFFFLPYSFTEGQELSQRAVINYTFIVNTNASRCAFSPSSPLLALHLIPYNLHLTLYTLHLLAVPCRAVPRRGKKGQEGARRGKKVWGTTPIYTHVHVPLLAPKGHAKYFVASLPRRPFTFTFTGGEGEGARHVTGQR